MPTILFRDAWFVAAFKPAGLLVHRTGLTPERESLLTQLRNQLGLKLNPAHRLDRAADGIILFGNTPEATAKLCEVFKQRLIRKTYLTLVRGFIGESGTIDYALKSEDGFQMQPAVTVYRRLATIELPYPVGRYPTARYSLVEAIPDTGRWHQLRRHFHHLSHPIIGDTTYGDSRHNHFFMERFGINRLLLTSIHLELIHPFTGEAISLRTLPGRDFIDMLDSVGLAEMVRSFCEFPEKVASTSFLPVKPEISA
jgi:tRNA pseudouridine65 synthase